MAPPLPNIEHVILLMFENRSFDNVLGALYPSTTNPDGGGVPANWSNPLPNAPPVAAWNAPVGSAAQNLPFPDPQESFADMSQQINTTPPMQGFVADYATVSNAKPANIMQYFVAQNVPVTQALAKAYAVSDRYFASGPVQTWPNRLFSLCGTPCYDTTTQTAYVNNPEYPHYPLMIGQLDQLSIFEQLDNAGYSWKVYFDDESPVSAIINYVDDHWDKVLDGGNVWPFESHPDIFHGDFFDDVQNNRLPTFSLIEPRYQMLSALGPKAPNSNHPGDSMPIGHSDIPINVSCGAQLLAKVFYALIANPTLFKSTLLIVTYDEHGGVFDHVTPPPATSPFSSGTVTGFDYSVYGVRVPVLFINPFVTPGVFRPPNQTGPDPGPPFDHTSILATLRDQFGLSPSLSPRVDIAPTFTGLINSCAQPIPAPNIPMPPCVWDSSSLRLGHAHPVLQTALWNASRRKVRRQ
ncbi:MAG TPA: alkaline phosphatase family protein [Pyrinomonadaceae bacterium]|nr:alkaline phosphatase family protein [Pyrinomonadaceae bacterium]